MKVPTGMKKMKIKRPYVGPPIVIHTQVWGPNKKMVYDAQMQKDGKFSFTTDKGGNYRFCLDYRQPKRLPMTNRIKVSWKLNVGDSLTDLNEDKNLAKKDQITNL